MNNKQNLHTHSTYCDGKDTPEQMIAQAKKLGFDSLGFSGHSFMHFSQYLNHSDKTEDYKKEITLLKEKYKGDIDIFLGLEFEMYAECDLSGYDYLIGSCHYFKLGDKFIGFDRSKEACDEIIKEHFGGDGLKFALEYYRQFAEITSRGKFDIIGHFDLIAKNNQKGKFFDENSKEYLDAAFCTLDAFKGKIPFFEVNTGGMARGYRTIPYPSIPLLKRMREMGFGAIITTDCHDKNLLDFCFEDARKLLKECGYKERYILTDSGFKAVEI